jgi:hypothetical protein
LISLRLTEKQGLIIRPMVPMVNSIPHFDQSGASSGTAMVADRHLSKRPRTPVPTSRSTTRPAWSFSLAAGWRCGSPTARRA